MTNEQIRAVIAKQTLKRIESRGQINTYPDVWEVSNKTCSTKYITKDGRVRLDIDFDVFKQLFETANWNHFLLELQTTDDDLMRATPYRVRRALDLYRCDDEIIALCEMLLHVRPMFDYREEKPPR